MFPVIFLFIKRCSNTELTPSCIYFWGCFIRCSGPQWSIWSTPKRYLSLNLIRRGCKCYAFETIWNILLYFIFRKWKPIYLTYIFHCLINLLISESLRGLRIQHFPSLTKHKTIFSQLHYDVLNHCLNPVVYSHFVPISLQFDKYSHLNFVIFLRFKNF